MGNDLAKISIIGAGSWGTALAVILAKQDHSLLLFARREQQVKEMRAHGENRTYLPGVPLPGNVRLTNDLAAAAADRDLILLATPSHTLRSVLENLKPHFGDKVPILVSLAKGIENETFLPMERVAEEVLGTVPFEYAALSGPSHAEEVARGIPTTVVVASRNQRTARLAQEALSCPTFRVYTHSDVLGVEFGGALKNIIALAAGICDGVGFGDNTKAALMTRGLAEITRLGVAMGAEALTFAGLSGMGDLIVTCISKHSRNRYVGEQVGRGRTLDEVLRQMVMVAEGVRTTKSAYFLARRQKVDMPITEKVYKVLFEHEAPRAAVADLMTREPKSETWGYA